MGTFDFSGTPLKNVPGRIIWIDDNFGGHYSYYMRAFGGRDISVDIHEFIQSELEIMGLTNADCTLAGFSKGGSAALYYMSRFGYRNCLAAVPQFAVGSYVENFWTKHLASMVDEVSPESVLILDSLIPKEIDEDPNKCKNIYLFTSAADDQYASEVVPNLDRLRGYHNFNYTLSESPLIREHNEVTRYNIPAIVSILTLLADGITPKFGEVVNGSDVNSTSLRRLDGQPVSAIDSVTFADGRLSIEGYAVLPGIAAPSKTSMDVFLEFRSSENSYRIRTSSTKNGLLNSKFYSERFFDYSYGGFSRSGIAGIPVDSFAPGIYSVHISAEYNYEGHKFTQIADVKEFGTRHLVTENGIYLAESRENRLILTVFTFSETSPNRQFFEVEKFDYIDGFIDTRGYFVPHNLRLDKWSSISYYLVAKSNSDTISILPLATGNRSNSSAKSGNSVLDQSKGFFSTKKYSPQEFRLSEFGSYDFQILAIANDQVFIQNLTDEFSIEIIPPTENLAKVGVIGSCVSRDLFNSRLNRRWKNSFEFFGAFYQMSLISLMSRPVDISKFDFSDLDQHAYLATKEDFTKGFLENIVETQPDFLLVDFRIDARFGVLQIEDGSWITDNKWKIGQAGIYRSFTSNQRVAMVSDQDKYLNIFKRSSRDFGDFIATNSPSTKLILNQPLSVSGFSGPSEYGNLNMRMNSAHNKYWSLLNSAFKEEVNCIDLIPNMDGILSDSRHPWGKGPVHYEFRYYPMVHDLLFRKIYS